MHDDFAIVPIVAIVGSVRALVAEASLEGFSFMERLISAWEDGTNRFDQPGEAYLGIWRGAELIGAGGLNCDPYCRDAAVGRVRHVYVRPAERRSGAGRVLMAEIVARARESFSLLRLRTTTARGAAFYESLKFEPVGATDASHVLRL